jgi:hypothetical protein
VYEEAHGPFVPLPIGGAMLIASVTALFAWTSGTTRRQHARFAAEGIQSAVENCLDLDDGVDHDEWDLFLASPIDDLHLESVRQRCIQVWEENGPGPVEARLRQELEKIHQELRTRPVQA